MTDGVLTWQWHTADGPGGHSYSYASHCSCYPVNSVKLPGYPVNSITHVKLNGTDLAASQYEIRDRRVLVMMRQADGSRITLPRWQDMTLPTTAFGTVEIEYKYGDAPPADGVTAAAILGWEIALSRQPATLALCRLPKRITSITRQGVTLAVLDPLSLFKDGLTGIPEVDLWTKSLDYGDARAEAEVIDPMRFPRATRSN